MTTIQDIINFSRPHPGKMDGAKQTVLSDGKVTISIVGGCQGLYGDFENDFELAILEVETKNFVTKYYVPEANDDVLSYQSPQQVEQLVNNIFSKGFQVL
jgi:hypothetical protein